MVTTERLTSDDFPGDASVLQFGTGKFLRAFADLFVHEVNGRPGATPARIVAVQNTGGPRTAQLTARGCRYHVAVRGLLDGQAIDRLVRVESLVRAMTAAADWPRVRQFACSPGLRSIVSNVTEAGYALGADDSPADSPPGSFPAKLLNVLQARWQCGLPGVAILPCELLEGNGERLLDLVLQQARRWDAPTDLIEWIRGACAWHNTLVDRIVSSPSSDDPLGRDDPLLAIAEPLAFWLVEGEPPALWSKHPAVRQVDALEPYFLRKVRILNGAHTALVAKALPLGIATVRQAMEDPAVRSWLEHLLFDEIVPVLAGRTEAPDAFARSVLERFANPWIDHRLSDIALHHATKVRTRLAPTQAEHLRQFRRPAPLLAEILGDLYPQ